MGGMQWASAISEEVDTRKAAQDAASRVAAELGGAPPDLAFVFFSTHHRSNPAAVAEGIAEALVPEHVLGCLDDYPTRSGFVITPVVVWGDAGADLRPDPREVESIHLLPLERLTPDKVVLQPDPESGRSVLALSLPQGLLYAPTAAVVFQFSEVAVHGRDTRVDRYEQPRFAWR